MYYSDWQKARIIRMIQEMFNCDYKDALDCFDNILEILEQ